MIKIAITVRNRLGITKKCIESIKRHTKTPYSIYVFDSLTNYRLSDHVNYFESLFEKKEIDFFSFANKKSTFNAFSKASCLNFFGHLHLDDPNKNNTNMIVLLDNDMIVRENWDLIALDAWKEIRRLQLNHVHIVTQYPGGTSIIRKITLNTPSASQAFLGIRSGSGFWCLKPDFFEKVGFLNLSNLVGLNKKHDQLYWKKLNQISKGRPYVAALLAPMSFHCGKLAGSICNSLTRTKDPNNTIFKESDEMIESLTFDEFYSKIKSDVSLTKW